MLTGDECSNMSADIKELMRKRHEVLIWELSECKQYIPDLLNFLKIDPDQDFHDCNTLKIFNIADNELLAKVEFNRRKKKYTITYIKDGFDIDRYLWSAALTRIARSHTYSKSSISDWSYRLYIDFNHVYNPSSEKYQLVDDI